MTVRELVDVVLNSTDVKFFNEREEEIKILTRDHLRWTMEDWGYVLSCTNVLYIEIRHDSEYEDPYLAVVMDTGEWGKIFDDCSRLA